MNEVDKARIELEALVEKLNATTKNVKFELGYDQNGKVKLKPIFQDITTDTATKA